MDTFSLSRKLYPRSSSTVKTDLVCSGSVVFGLCQPRRLQRRNELSCMRSRGLCLCTNLVILCTCTSTPMPVELSSAPITGYRKALAWLTSITIGDVRVSDNPACYPVSVLTYSKHTAMPRKPSSVLPLAASPAHSTFAVYHPIPPEYPLRPDS